MVFFRPSKAKLDHGELEKQKIKRMPQRWQGLTCPPQ